MPRTRTSGPGPGKTPDAGSVTPDPARREQSDADQDEAREAMLEAEQLAEAAARYGEAG